MIQESQLHRLQDWQVNTFLKSAYTELVGQAQFTVFRQCGDAGWQIGPPWSGLQSKGCVRGLALPSAGCHSSWVPLGVRVFQDFAMIVPMIVTTSPSLCMAESSGGPAFLLHSGWLFCFTLCSADFFHLSYACSFDSPLAQYKCYCLCIWDVIVHCASNCVEMLVTVVLMS